MPQQLRDRVFMEDADLGDVVDPDLESEDG